MPRDDTLTAAEEQALARARRAVRSSTSSGSGTTTRSRSGGSGTGKRTGGSSSRSKGSGSRTRSSSRKRGSATRSRRRGSARSVTLDTARGTALIVAIGLAAAPAGSLPDGLGSAGGTGFGLADLLPAAFAVLAGVALDHQIARHAKERGRWWAGRWARRVAVLVAAGLLVTWLGHRDTATLAWTSPYARLAVGGLVAWFVLRDLSRRAQAVLVIAWVAASGVAALRGRTLLAGLDGDLLGTHVRAPLDPDGVVGTLASAALIVVGAWLGGWLRSRPDGPATATAFALTAVYTGVAGIAVAQVVPVSALRWTPPALLLGTSLAVALLALGHLGAAVAPTAARLRWIAAAGRVALPVGVAALLAGHLLGVGTGDGPWHHLATAILEPLVGLTWTGVALGVAAAAAAARLGAALVDHGWLLRA